MNEKTEEKKERETGETVETFDPNQAVGMEKEAAAEWFQGYGYQMRVTRWSGTAAVVTRDYRMNRINVAVENGKVIDVLSVG